jgi:hypothetical protein
MKKYLIVLCAILAIAILGVPASAAPGTSSGAPSNEIGLNTSSAPVNLVFQGETEATITPRVTTTPRPVQRRPMGEVQYPITHPIQPITPAIPAQPTPVPVIRETTERTPAPRTPERTPTPPITQPPTPPVTTQPPTPPVTTQPQTTGPTPVVTTPVPTPTPIIVTVTVPVYPYGSVYNPYYYYPPGYVYPINSYYPSGSLTVTSYPPNALVVIDGYNQETTPWVYTNLLSGYHTVEINYPGYEAYVTNVYLNDGESQEIDANLLTLGNYGSMFITSTPPGADVYVDGNYEGVSPVTVSALTQGPHIVELHLSGYDPQVRTVDVSSGQGANVNVAMSSYNSASTDGSIDVTSNVLGSMVYLDGTYKGLIRDTNVFNVVAVNPGSHTLLVHAPGYNDFTQTVQVYSGQIASANAVLTLSQTPQGAPSTQQAGSIVAQSIPSGGQVFLDNQFRGVAPVTIYNVAPGDHIVNMKLAGNSDWSGSLTVQPGQVAQVAATFTPGTGTSPAPTRAGLPMATGISAIAVAALIIANKSRK